MFFGLLEFLTVRTSSDRELVISSQRKSNTSYWAELFRQKDLIAFLVWKDLLVRYKQAVLGVGWALLRPILTMAIFTFVFSRVAKLDSGPIPYSLYVLAGLIPWQLFSTALAEASHSLIDNANMISKIYFPRMALPLTTIFVNLFDTLISLVLLFALSWFFIGAPSYTVLLLPLILLQIIFLALGLGSWLAALNARYRDFRYIVPFMVQVGIYISPVGYSAKIVPERFQDLYFLNPLVGIIGASRYAFFGVIEPRLLESVAYSVAVTLVLLFLGIFYFRSIERSLADII